MRIFLRIVVCIFGIIAALILAAYTSCSLEYPTYTIRWRLIVEIDTPDGVRTGSSVLESQFFKTFGAVGGASSSLKGEAVFVDLGNGKFVIAALAHGKTGADSGTISALPVTTLTKAGRGSGVYRKLQEMDGVLSGEAVLDARLIPTMVTFDDVDDPRSVRILDPFGDDFERQFGEGVRFKQAKVEIVPYETSWLRNLFGPPEVPITTDIVDKLSWLLTMDGYGLSGAPYCHPKAICLYRTSFRRL